MRLADHIIKEHRTVPMIRESDNKRFLVRIARKTQPNVAGRHPASHPELPYFADVWNEFKIKASRTWHPYREATEYLGEFASVSDALEHYKRLGFRFLHPRKLQGLLKSLKSNVDTNCSGIFSTLTEKRLGSHKFLSSL